MIAHPSTEILDAVDILWENKIRSLRVKVTFVLLLTQILDLILTFWVLSMGGYETNPLAGLLISMGLIVPLKLGAAGLALWKAKYGRPSRFQWNNLDELKALMFASIVLGVYYLVIVINTITLLHYLTL